MQLITLLSESSVLLYSITIILGLTIGSFLNVVIHRLPIMLERDWRQQCLEYLEQTPENHSQPETFNLLVPRSACPKCGHKIKAWENIPVLSYLFLRGRCSNCSTRIPFQYPAIEMLTGILSFVVVWHLGLSIQTGFALLLTWSLIALSMIDLKHTLLPDDITLPMLWLGLLLSTNHIFVSPIDSIIGAAIGYLAFWSIFHVFRLITGKEGMGYGDFKLLAMLGAWFGWQSLALIIILSSLMGAVVGIAMIIIIKHDRQKPIPFGPYLALAGWITLIWGQQLNIMN